MAEISCIIKGKFCKFKVDKREVFMQSENTGGHMINLGEPQKMKKNILLSRNKYPQFCIDFVKSWKQVDIDRVSKMETDEEMLDDMRKDFMELGYEIVEK